MWFVYIVTTGVVPVGFGEEADEARRFYDDVVAKRLAFLETPDPSPTDRLWRAVVPGGEICVDLAHVTSIAITGDPVAKPGSPGGNRPSGSTPPPVTEAPM